MVEAMPILLSNIVPCRVPQQKNYAVKISNRAEMGMFCCINFE